jgi:hypothetical protein
MTTEKLERLKALLYLALVPIETKHKNVFKSSIKYCVVLDKDGNLVLSDWLNDYPEIKEEIRVKYNWALSLA